MRRRRLLLLFGAIAAVATAGALALVSQAGKPPSLPPKGNLDLERATSFEPFTIYYAREAFEGLPLSAILRRLDRKLAREPVRADYVSFLYGDCDARPDFGCALPLEIQNWRVCARNPTAYESAPGKLQPGDPIEVRGVPGRLYEAGERLEIYTGDTAIVLFGEREQILRAAEELQAVNADVGPREPLQPPRPGALEGKLRCP